MPFGFALAKESGYFTLDSYMSGPPYTEPTNVNTNYIKRVYADGFAATIPQTSTSQYQFRLFAMYFTND